MKFVFGVNLISILVTIVKLFISFNPVTILEFLVNFISLDITRECVRLYFRIRIMINRIIGYAIKHAYVQHYAVCKISEESEEVHRRFQVVDTPLRLSRKMLVNKIEEMIYHPFKDRKQIFQLRKISADLDRERLANAKPLVLWILKNILPYYSRYFLRWLLIRSVSLLQRKSRQLGQT